jgi:DNA-binding transcriptional LysR family regulator
MHDIDLRDLNAFVAVARQRNFRRAAIQQRVSASSLSQRMRDLEEQLGVRLLNRTTRSVALTEAGARLLQRIAPALDDVMAATIDARTRRDVPSGRLRINGPEPALRLVLAPMVAPFLKRFPEIRLEIVTDSSLIDIVSEGFDAGIRYEETLAQDMVAISLGPPERYAVVAAPAFLKNRKRPAHPNDLVGEPCIVTRFRSGLQPTWDFRKANRRVKFRAEGPLIAAHPELQLQAAVDGLGFLMTMEGYALDAIASGRLVRVLDDWCAPSPGPFLYYPGRRQQPPSLNAFIAFVKEWRRKDAAGS